MHFIPIGMSAEEMQEEHFLLDMQAIGSTTALRRNSAEKP